MGHIDTDVIRDRKSPTVLLIVGPFWMIIVTLQSMFLEVQGKH